MKHLPTVNARSIFAAAGQHAANGADMLDDIESQIIDPIEKMRLKLECHKVISNHLSTQTKLISSSLKNRELDQTDKLNNIKTDYRNPEVRNFENDPPKE